MFLDKPNKVVFGFCISDCGATGSNANANQAVQVMSEIKAYNNEQFKCNGGAFFWVGFKDTNGVWSDAVVNGVSLTAAAGCSKSSYPTPTKQPVQTSSPTKQPVAQTIYCWWTSCTQLVWNSLANDGGGTHSCGARITWLKNSQGYNQAGACTKVESEFPEICLCGAMACRETQDPSKLPTAQPTSITASMFLPLNLKIFPLHYQRPVQH